ncbi:hypothetical protein [Tropicimonas sp. IMCC6043]|uniref:hypothetical protein n=1 Tax=Tropicimonas sp. IMCC6043 TaxID=2510645 RepID=UPI00101C20EF|nr:hypothetical protein [Tropicimonas sp. IMCC6043]RYH09989.1 hypothetical protein EU800_10600 [Tropicimonas sp. IMCC6043]
MKRVLLVLLLSAQTALAADFTTAAEVKPILGMQKDRWLAVREYDGRDLLYFTALLSWRCGLAAIHYGLNGAAADEPLPMEDCHEGTSAPNALSGDDPAIYIEAPLGSIQSVRLRVTYDDGIEEDAEYQRESILMP